jgi:hypothetical protein
MPVSLTASATTPVTASAARNLSWFARCRSALGPVCRVPIAGPGGFRVSAARTAVCRFSSANRAAYASSSFIQRWCWVKMTPDSPDALLMMPVLANAARNDSCCSWRRSLLVAVMELDYRRKQEASNVSILSSCRGSRQRPEAPGGCRYRHAVTSRRSERASRFRWPPAVCHPRRIGPSHSLQPGQMMPSALV